MNNLCFVSSLKADVVTRYCSLVIPPSLSALSTSSHSRTPEITAHGYQIYMLLQQSRQVSLTVIEQILCKKKIN